MIKAFAVLDAIISIIKANQVLTYNVNDFEPGDGFIEDEKLPAVFCYIFDTDLTEANSSDQGDQTHTPNYYIDIIYDAKATRSQSTGTITSSVDKAHELMRGIIKEIYSIIMNKQFRDWLEAITGYTGGHIVKRYEKLGVSRGRETNKTFVGGRFTINVTVTEDPDGDDGVTLGLITDSITPELKS